MIIAELNGALIGRVFEDTAKMSAASCNELYAYETPRDCAGAELADVDQELSNGNINTHYKTPRCVEWRRTL